MKSKSQLNPCKEEQGANSHAEEALKRIREHAIYIAYTQKPSCRGIEMQDFCRTETKIELKSMPYFTRVKEMDWVG